MADDGIILARITITRVLTEGDIVDHVTAEQGDGEVLGLADALGMVELAKFTLVHSRSWQVDEDDED